MKKMITPEIVDQVVGVLHEATDAQKTLDLVRHALRVPPEPADNLESRLLFEAALAGGRAGVQLAPSRKKRLYLAGPMTGLPDLNFPAFNAAAAALRERGYHVENPAEHGIVEGAEWGDYLRYDIGRLVTCEGIALLPGWFDSKGARLEANIAKELGMEITLLDGAEGYTSSFCDEDRKKRSRLWAEYPEIMHRHVLRHDQMLAARRDSEMRAQLAAGDVVESDLPAPHDAAETNEDGLDPLGYPLLPSRDDLLGALNILRSGWDTGNVDEAVAQCIDHLNACLGEEGGAQ